MTASDTKSWPYDAIQDDPLTAMRIPVVRSIFPHWMYEVCVVIAGEDDNDSPWGGMRPTSREAEQIRAYIDWRMEYYNVWWRAGMRKKPLDTDNSTNTVILLKQADGNWRYRRRSCEIGPVLIPAGSWHFTLEGKSWEQHEVLDLEQLLDKINHLQPEKWQAWKDAHPEAFGPDGGETA